MPYLFLWGIQRKPRASSCSSIPDAPAVVTLTVRATGGLRSCQACTTHVPGGTAGISKLPSTAACVKWPPAITWTNATIRGWTLQKMRTRPGLVNVQVLASPRPYCPRSNGSGPDAENTLWSKGS